MSTQGVITQLRALGLDAQPGHPPTELTVSVPGGTVLATYGHNRDGWEAVFENEDARQLPLLDGPDDPDAATPDVARWLVALTYDWERWLS